MKLWNNKPTPPDGAVPDRLREIAAEKVAAAQRLSAGIAEMGAAADALLAADRAFWAEWLVRHGNNGFGVNRLMRQMRPFLLTDLELNAPVLLKYFDELRQWRARCDTFANRIAKQVEQDLAVEPQPQPEPQPEQQEPAQ